MRMNSSRIALSKVLLPVDFSEKSVEAARYAVKLLKSFRPQVTLLHVLTQHYGFDMPGLENEELTRFLAEDESNARTQLEKFLKPDFRNLNMKRVLIKGDPAQRIVEYAHSEKFNLIIMPTHGRGPFRRRLLGSV